jgi:hypothetical protein
MNGVVSNIGIVNKINNVCICDMATVNATALALPMKIELNAPTQVGHAMNNPVVAPKLLIPLPFLKKVKALIANDVFNPTK